MMRMAYTVAAPDGGAPPLALHGDFRRNLALVREAGFDGVELYVRNPARLDPSAIARQIDDAGLAMPAVCTGEVFGTDGLSLSAEDQEVRRRALDRTRRIIAFAAHWRAAVNIGRLRGPIPPGPAADSALARVEEAFRALAEDAAGYGVTMILEPINRHELNFITTTTDGLGWVRRIDHPSFQLMLDLYHVHLEDPAVAASFIASRGVLRHVHLSDSNRLAPGWGHLNLKEVLATLQALGYAGWVAVEVRQVPTPEAAVSQSGRHLRELLVSLATQPPGT
jgi:sugar phosphate isomerase/epimerase